MTTSAKQEPLLGVREAATKLADRFRQELQTPTSFDHFLSFSEEIYPLDLLSWLNHQNFETKIFWQNRSRQDSVAGLDSAHTLSGGQEILQMAPISSGRYFGGFAFDSSRIRESMWKSFANGCFILPRVQITQKSDHTFLVAQCRLTREEIQKTIGVLQTLIHTVAPMDEGLPLPENRLDTPSQPLWERHVTQVLKAIRGGLYEKIVLARKVKLEFREALNPVTLLSELNRRTSNCFCFLFQFAQGAAFLGASPERLYSRKSLSLETEALAGTRPKGKSQPEDEALILALQNSTKDQQEHSIVINMIKDHLLTLCDEFYADDFPRVLDWSGGHHLLTSFRGQLKRDITDYRILSTLHPTPAVGGCPTKDALELIQQTEPFDRGWYTGPVGYFSPQESEFAVAIRSGFVQHKSLSIYAGAGIVKDSIPSQEWDETENKMSSFLEIFNVNP